MTTEQDYADAAAWAEYEMTPTPGSTTALRGGAAAAYGATVLAAATGNDPAVVMTPPLYRAATVLSRSASTSTSPLG